MNVRALHQACQFQSSAAGTAFPRLSDIASGLGHTDRSAVGFLERDMEMQSQASIAVGGGTIIVQASGDRCNEVVFGARRHAEPACTMCAYRRIQ